jgi:hypothetical protein
MKLSVKNYWPMCGEIKVITAWHAFSFCWHLKVQLWGRSRGSIFLGPMQFCHVDLGRVAVLEAMLDMKWAK